jgi:adenine phosphoribosyltransferase
VTGTAVNPAEERIGGRPNGLPGGAGNFRPSAFHARRAVAFAPAPSALESRGQEPGMDLSPFIRDVPDFPKPGIVFKDITPLLGDPAALRHVTEATVARFAGERITKVVGIESRGFIMAPAIALGLGCGFAPIRKPGKLPWKCYEESYSLEYGKDRIEIHVDAVHERDRVLIVDDVLATGGTMGAALKLVRRCGATVAAVAVLADLAFLGGSKKLDCPVFTILTY